MAVHTDPTATAADAVVAAEAATRFAELMDGYLGTQLLYVAAELDLMEALRGAPRSAAEVAAVVEADAATLERVLRGLAAYGAVVEHPGRRFSVAPLGELLCADRPGAQRGAMLARGLEHRVCMRVSSAVELPPGECACDQRGHDGRGDSQAHQPQRAGGSSCSCHRAGDQDDF